MRLLAACLCVAAALAVGPPAGGQVPVPACGPRASHLDLVDAAAPASAVAGTSVYEGGTFVHSDYVYDDYGPTGVRPGLVADTSTRPAGSYVYPTDEPRFVNNAADLRQLRLRLDGDALVLEAHLQSLAAADTTAVAVGFDLDGGQAAVAAFPHALGVSAAGLDVTVTVSGDGATLTRAGGDPVALDGATVDLEENVLAVPVPLGALAVQGDTFRVWAMSGLWDAAASTFAGVLPVPTSGLPGGRQVVADVRAFDSGFHPGERGVDGWFDVGQAAALAAADVSDLAGTVDLGLMRDGADVPWEPQPGYYEVVHRSAFTLPPYHEGWSGTGSGGTDDNALAAGFQGRHQPYALYVPSQVAAGEPLALTVFFHGGTRNHSDLPSGESMQQQLGEGLGSLIASPLARRGHETDYDDERLADVREVLTDVHRRFPVDPDRRYLTGYSQGGNGVYRSMTFMADEWAAATIWAGQSPDAVPWLESTRWVPSILLHSPTDELVPYQESVDTHERLVDLGYEHELRTHAGGHLHQGETDDYTQPVAWFGARTRDAPAQVTFVRVPAEDEVDHGLVFDSAYWLSGIAATGDRGVVEALTSGLGGSLPGVEEVFAEETGPPTPYLREGLAYVRPGTAIAPANALVLDLQGIGALTVDTARAGLDPSEPVALRVVTDGPARVALAGPGAVGLSGDGRLEDGACGPAVVYDAVGEFTTTLVAAGPIVRRLAGEDRVATAATVALATTRTAGPVVLARADAYADALAGAPLAAALDAPLLLTAPDALSGAAADAITRLGATSAVLLGGEAALSADVADDLATLGIGVRRVAGADRYATAAAIAGEVGGDGVLLAEGAHADPARGWPDALAAAALGAATGRPVLLVTHDALPAATAGLLTADVDAVVVGGPAAVSEEVVAAVDQRAGNVRRLAGPDRYATAVAAAQQAMADGASVADVWLATGDDWPDGLVAGAAAGLDRGVLLLVDDAGAPAADFLAQHTADVRTVSLAGGEAAISASAERAVRDALGQPSR